MEGENIQGKPGDNNTARIHRKSEIILWWSRWQVSMNIQTSTFESPQTYETASERHTEAGWNRVTEAILAMASGCKLFVLNKPRVARHRALKLRAAHWCWNFFRCGCHCHSFWNLSCFNSCAEIAEIKHGEPADPVFLWAEWCQCVHHAHNERAPQRQNSLAFAVLTQFWNQLQVAAHFANNYELYWRGNVTFICSQLESYRKPLVW